ncbi:MAG: pantoate--beta-alanine ligase [Oceanobacter sp.]
MEVRNTATLETLNTPNKHMEMVILGAAWLGKARLIDNVTFLLK